MAIEEPTLDDPHLDDDTPEVEIPMEAITHVDFDPSLCLIRRFLTDRLMRAYIKKEKISLIWRLLQRVAINEINQDTFHFQFF